MEIIIFVKRKRGVDLSLAQWKQKDKLNDKAGQWQQFTCIEEIKKNLNLHAN